MRKLLLLLALCVPVYGATPDQWKADYDLLQKWQYGAPVPLTKPITITRDTATFTLTSGSVALAAPTSSGRVTGLVFEGDGRFTMTVPDKYELAQLRRFADAPLLTQIDEPMTQLVLRVSDDTIDKLFPGAAKVPFDKNAIAEKRQNHWLIDLRRDVDARIVTAMANPGAAQWTAGIKTKDYDWLTYDYDSSRGEEIQLIRWNQIPESWLSLDRPEDRGADGRPGPREGHLAKLDHIDVKADLTKLSRTERVGETEQRLILGHYIVDETLTPLVTGTVALPLELHPWAQKLTAKDEKGQPLVVLRDHIGGRTMQLDKKTNDGTLTVLFPEGLKSGEARHVTFEYDLESANYVDGSSWYPTVPEAFDAHTAKLALTVGKKSQVRSMGRKESEKESDGATTSVWLVEKPAMMVTFVTAEHFEEVPLDVKGIPQVVSFGWAAGLGSTANRVRNSGADVANALQFYQYLLDDQVGGEKFYVTSIAGNHGQAFDGFLHLAESSYEEHPGASELFRGHETAHEWFGHKVGWKTYRDQWLSESLAEYASMMFVQSTVKDGPKHFNEILDVYDSIVRGNISSIFSKYQRPWLLDIRASARKRVGPIGIGERADTGDYPIGYEVQAYVKGPLVIHMLRSMLQQKTHNDDVFVKVLRDYVHDYSGKLATTADFQKVLEKDAPGNWGWFFDDWVYGAEIPTIRWSYKVEPDGNAYRLTLNMKRADVSPDFMLIVPVRLEFDGNKVATIFVPMKDAAMTVQKQLPANPKNVVLGADHSLLANIKKE